MAHTLPGTTVEHAAELKTDLLALLKESGPLTLNGEKISKIDTAFVQLMLAFMRAAHERKIIVSWRNPSEYLIDKAELLGIKTDLGLI